MKDESHLNVGGSVYTCVLCICMHAHVQHGKKKLEVFMPQAIPVLWDWVSHSTELTMHTRLAGHKVLEIHPSLLTVLGLHAHTTMPNLYVGSGAWTQVLIHTWQRCYWLSHLPSYQCFWGFLSSCIFLAINPTWDPCPAKGWKGGANTLCMLKRQSTEGLKNNGSVSA